jgi:hypothetical protein
MVLPSISMWCELARQAHTPVTVLLTSGHSLEVIPSVSGAGWFAGETIATESEGVIVPYSAILSLDCGALVLPLEQDLGASGPALHVMLDSMTRLGKRVTVHTEQHSWRGVVSSVGSDHLVLAKATGLSSVIPYSALAWLAIHES